MSTTVKDSRFSIAYMIGLDPPLRDGLMSLHMMRFPAIVRTNKKLGWVRFSEVATSVWSCCNLTNAYALVKGGGMLWKARRQLSLIAPVCMGSDSGGSAQVLSLWNTMLLTAYRNFKCCLSSVECLLKGKGWTMNILC